MSLRVYTSQYRYSGPHRLDITVKGNSHIGKAFAPSWALVTAYQQTKDEQAYKNGFHQMMIASLDSRADVWLDDILKRDFIVLVCFCKAGDFCHRTLVADYLVQLGATYLGEIGVNDNPFKPPTIEECFGKKAYGIRCIDVLYYYVHHESNCVWTSNNPNEAHELVEEIDMHLFNSLITNGYNYKG